MDKFFIIYWVNDYINSILAYAKWKQIYSIFNGIQSEGIVFRTLTWSQRFREPKFSRKNKVDIIISGGWRILIEIPEFLKNFGLYSKNLKEICKINA